MTPPATHVDISSHAYFSDPFPTLRQMRAAGPFITTKLPLVGTICLTTNYEAGEFLLKHSQDFSVDLRRAGKSGLAVLRKLMPRNIRLLSTNMLTMDDPDHRRLRKMVDGAFSRREIEAWRPRIQAVTERQLDQLYASDDRDLVRHVSRDLPLSVICELLGLPDADRPQFKHWMAALSSMTGPRDLLRIMGAMAKMSRYLRARFAYHRADPGDDLISKLVMAQADGEALSDDELLAMCFMLFIAGHETTMNLISGGVLELIRHPDQAQMLRARPELDAPATEEMLRYVSPVQATKPRMPLQDMELMGTKLRRGQPIMVHLAAANSDPARFAHPERFDITREDNRHLGLGGGMHLCLGNWLARAEMQIVTRALLERAPDLALAVPPSQLRWQDRMGHRALDALPLAL